MKLKKIIAPILITLIVVGYGGFLLYLGIRFAGEISEKILMAIIGLGICFFAIHVL